MSVTRRREMIEASHLQLAVIRQCTLLGISRSRHYHSSAGESEQTLALMRLIDETFHAEDVM